MIISEYDNTRVISQFIGTQCKHLFLFKIKQIKIKLFIFLPCEYDIQSHQYNITFDTSESLFLTQINMKKKCFIINCEKSYHFINFFQKFKK